MNNYIPSLKKRTHTLKSGDAGAGPVVYWMQRDQRVINNWAFIAAFETAKTKNKKLIVIFNFVDNFLLASERHYYFMIEGLKEVEQDLICLKIEFIVLVGKPGNTIPAYLSKIKADSLFTDFNPLKIVTDWKNMVADNISLPFYEIDAHNIVPCRIASDKQEFAAYTIRSKINRLLLEFSIGYPEIESLQNESFKYNAINWDDISRKLNFVKIPETVNTFIPGRNAALKILQNFLDNKIFSYTEGRNDPNLNAGSGLSPYLHFGQISSQEILLFIKNHPHANPFCDEFLDELIIRKELSDNFCFYNKDYDNFKSFPGWAKKTLDEHRGDKREYIYSLKQFENAETHDLLWNAAQTEMIKSGNMHGYLRMYWAKKILEWTGSPGEALEYGIYLNDKYELDGRDPNGYAGLAWSIGGVHDRAWQERPVFGKIRYMNFNGCKRKFDVKKYILSTENL